VVLLGCVEEVLGGVEVLLGCVELLFGGVEGAKVLRC
jgi:hypothetical protein